MNELKISYVYEHWRPDKNECFYVGKGHGYRSSNMDAGRSNHHKNIVAKLFRLGLSVKIRIVADGLTNDEASKLKKVCNRC